MGHLVGVIRRPHHGTDRRVLKAHGQRFLLEILKYRRVNIALYRQMIRGRREILTERNHIDLM